MNQVVLNVTAVSPSTTVPTPVLSSKYLSILGVPFAVPYTVGMLGNLLAMCVLHRTRRESNRKHWFMLRCLAVSDAVALNGLLVLFFVNTYRAGTKGNVWTCRFRVLMRFFSVESSCVVSSVMAVERWLALTKPFVYHRCISLCVIKKMMFTLWFGVLCMACAPFFGFGIYWDEESSTCVRYRHAKKTLDVVYVYVYFSFGLLQCLAIVYMNLEVMRVLWVKNSSFNIHNTMIRHVNRGTLLMCTATTKREKSFGRLMLLLSVTFLLCWIPHLVLIPLNRFIDDDDKMRPFNIVADMLIVLHFTLDPYLYVLQHWSLIKLFFRRPPSEGNINRIAIISYSSSSRKSCTVSLEKA